jgi:hypothetical protein
MSSKGVNAEISHMSPIAASHTASGMIFSSNLDNDIIL